MKNIKKYLLLSICIFSFNIGCTQSVSQDTKQTKNPVIIDSVIDNNIHSPTIEYTYYHTKKEPEYLDSIKVHNLKDKTLLYVEYPNKKRRLISYYPNKKIESISYDLDLLEVDDTAVISYHQNGNIKYQRIIKDSLISNENGNTISCIYLDRYYYSNSILEKVYCKGLVYKKEGYYETRTVGTENNYDNLGRLTKTISYHPSFDNHNKDYAIITKYDSLNNKINEKIYKYCIMGEANCQEDYMREIKEIPK